LGSRERSLEIAFASTGGVKGSYDYATGTICCDACGAPVCILRDHVRPGYARSAGPIAPRAFHSRGFNRRAFDSCATTGGRVSGHGATAGNGAYHGQVVVKEGTDVKLKFVDDLSSKTAVDGDPVNLVLDEDLKVGDVVVAKAGSPATAEITNAKKAGMMGKPGELNLRLDHLKVGDQRVRLRGSKGKEGEGKVGTAVALTVLFGPIGLIKHGKNVEVKAGTLLTAYVDEDIALEPAM
jgi:hypothetical protein